MGSPVTVLTTDNRFVMVRYGVNPVTEYLSSTILSLHHWHQFPLVVRVLILCPDVKWFHVKIKVYEEVSDVLFEYELIHYLNKDFINWINHLSVLGEDVTFDK